MPNRLWRYNLLQSLCRIVYCISENFDQNQCRWWQCRRTKWSFFHEIRAEVFIECITVANYVIVFYCLYWELSFKCAFSLYLLSNHAQFLYQYKLHQWASYQIRKIAGCTCAGNAGNVFPATGCKPLIGSAARVSRTCRDTCRDRQPAAAVKTFPTFAAHAQPAILRIWQKAHTVY